MQTSLLALSFSLFVSYSPGLLILSLHLGGIELLVHNYWGWKGEMIEKTSPWRWCLGIILEQMERMETTVKSLERKEGRCHLYAALLHPHLSCLFPFALSLIQPFNYLMYILSTYCLSGTDVYISPVTAELSTNLSSDPLRNSQRSLPQIFKSHHPSSARSPSPAPGNSSEQ